LTVEDSLFECIGMEFDKEIVSQYKTEETEGRASLFWFEGKNGYI